MDGEEEKRKSFLLTTAELHFAAVANRVKFDEEASLSESEGKNNENDTASLSEKSRLTIKFIFWFNLTLDVLSHLALSAVLADVIDYHEDDVSLTVFALVIYNGLLIVAIVPSNLYITLYTLYSSTWIHYLFACIRCFGLFVSSIAIIVKPVTVTYSFWFLFQSIYLAAVIALLLEKQRK